MVPAYNEAAGIVATVTSLLDSRYAGAVEVIVVDDGSTDATPRIVAGLARPGLRLISQPNAGKPAALNHGIAVARHDILVLVDGDTVFQPDTLARLVARMQDPAIGAVSGNTKVGNRSGLLGRWQHLEYVMGFNLDRRMYDVIRAMPTVPRLTPLWALPLQQVVYRQLLYLVTVQSLITALLGSQQRWQPLRRTGVFRGQPPGRRDRALKREFAADQPGLSRYSQL